MDRKIRFMVILSFVLLIPVLGFSAQFRATVIDHDHLELSWDIEVKDAHNILAYTVFEAHTDFLGEYQTENLTWSTVKTLAVDQRRMLIQHNASVEPPVTLYKLVGHTRTGKRDLGFAARLIIHRPERLFPVMVIPSDVKAASALADLWRRGVQLFDYARETPLRSSDPVHLGMVVQVCEPLSEEVVLAGSIPPQAQFYFPAGRLTGFAFPLFFPEQSAQDLFQQIPGFQGLLVYSDTNALPLPPTARLRTGERVYAFLPEREFWLTLPEGKITLGETEVKRVIPSTSTKKREYNTGRDNSVCIVYDSSYQTAHYKCWLSGRSGPWDGITDSFPGVDDVINAAVVRRGRMVYLDDTNITSGTPITIRSPAPPGEQRVAQSFTIGWSAAQQCATVTIPADAPIGDYQFQVGSVMGNYCTVYVMFDVMEFSQSNGGPFTDNEMVSWAYHDTPYTGTGQDGYGSVYDYLNFQYWGPVYGPGSTTILGYCGAPESELGRDGGLFGQRTVELFSSIHGWGATTPLEAAIHVYQITGQRLTWTYSPYYGEQNGYLNHHDHVLAGDVIYTYYGSYTSTELDVQTAENAALGMGFSNRLSASHIYNCGQCMNFGAFHTYALRSIGLPSRIHWAGRGGGWIGSFHVWSDAAFLNDPYTPQSWGGIWYKMDSCDIYSSSYTAHFESHIGPVVFDGFGDYMLNTYEDRDGPGYRGRYDLNESYMGSDYATHIDSMIKGGTTANPFTSDLTLTISSTGCPYRAYDSYADASGTAQSSEMYVLPGDHGYALNDNQWRDYGTGFDPGFTDDENIPLLNPGESIRGVVAGWGAAWYRISPGSQNEVEVFLEEGMDEVKLYGRWDEPISSTQARHSGLNYDLGPVTSIDTNLNGRHLFILVQGEDNFGSYLNSQQVVHFTLKRTDFSQPIPTLSSVGTLIMIVLFSLVLSSTAKYYKRRTGG